MDPHKLFNRYARYKRNVVGYSGQFKLKESHGRVKPVMSLRVYVREKHTDPTEVRALERDGQLIPPVVEGMPTDVEAVGTFTAGPCDDTLTTLQRPAPGGVSAMSLGGTACTLGWYAVDNVDGKLVLIANNHCTAGQNKHSPGHWYMQPSPNDGAPEKLGELKRFVPIDFERYTCGWRQAVARDFNPIYVPSVNRVDLGLVDLDPADALMEIPCIGPLRGKRRAVIDELVMKTGRTTGHTRDGPVRDMDYHGQVGYSRGKAQFGPIGLIRKAEFMKGGDSSSAIVAQSDRYFVGLGFAASPSHSLFCHVDHIESEGNVRITW